MPYIFVLRPAVLKQMIYLFVICFILTIGTNSLYAQITRSTDPEYVFKNPPESASPGMLWMWMGSNLSKEGITRDLEAMKAAGFNRTTMFSLSDVTTPWAGEIGNSPTPEIISWTEPWWKLVQHAAKESRRLKMDFGMFNGPSYESSGGNWITPELSMQEICSSQFMVAGGRKIDLVLNRPTVDPRANQMFPIYNPETKRVEKPEIPARKSYYVDIAVLAAPSSGVVSKENIVDLTSAMDTNGRLLWDAPAGDWTIYRFGHTTMGKLIQPAQWQATGLECDKMSQEAIDFHMDHVIAEINTYLGDFIGNGFTHVHFDSYEAGNPTWTPKMPEEFKERRGYDLLPYLLTFANRSVESLEESAKFKHDFEETIKDLYSDIYFATIRRKLNDAKLDFLCEPYGGPWRQDDILPQIDKVMTEFWTNGGVYRPYELDPTVTALRKSGQNIVEAEAFTGDPNDSKWDETPAWLKPIGDAAFCAGVNRFILHRFVQQPWDNRYLPGATMGQWGTHFDRTQTWWNSIHALVDYWKRCQALLQWGNVVIGVEKDFEAKDTEGDIALRYIHRKLDNTDVYFVANTSRRKGRAICRFNVAERQPELWDPVTGDMRLLPDFTVSNGEISIPLDFDEAQSFFIVFRKQIRTRSREVNFPKLRTIQSIAGDWKVKFDPRWGGPKKPVVFKKLEDWTDSEILGIKYYSGTASYQISFDVNDVKQYKTSRVYLHLGKVNHLARIKLNNKDLGIVWTAPWHIEIPVGLLKLKGNKLEIQVTNVWANRLIGDEQEPADLEWINGHQGGRFLKEFPDWFVKNQTRPSKGRYCFTTWNYFTKDSPLVSSGLIGPVELVVSY